jgi:tetratricopeptide (TPR) repeat protein
MARQIFSFRHSLALAAFILFSLFAQTGVATAQSSQTIAAEQNCANATKQGNTAAAVSACTEALSLAPNNALVALMLCAGQTGVGNYAAAVTSCTQAIALNAKAETAYVDRCDANLMLGNLANAVSDCTQATALDPSDPTPHINLADIDLKQQNYAAAITESNKAIALAPTSAAAIANRGLANVGLGNTAAALADFQNALKIDPSNASALIGMKYIGQPVPAASTTPAPAPPALAPVAGNTISICNEFSITIHAAFAVQSQGHFTAAGWWNVDPNKCEPANFNFAGTDALYYAAESDSFKNGNDTSTEIWGAETGLYVIDQKFNFTDAEQNRNGRRAEQFNALALTPDQQASTLALTFHFAANHTTNINIIVTKP